MYRGVINRLSSNGRKELKLCSLTPLLSLQRPDAGLGVFASREVQKTLQVSWKRPYYRFCKPNDGIVLASFPLQAAITRQTILSDPVLGQTYKELLDIGM